MSVPNHCLDIARNAFGLLVAGPRPVSVDGRLFEGLPDRLVPVDELRDLLLKRNCPAATRNAVWAHLVRRSRADSARWTVVAVGVALPSLTDIAARLSAGLERDDGEIHAEVLSGFLSALRTVDPDAPKVLARLRQAAHRAGSRARRQLLADPVAMPQAPHGHVDLVLACAVEQGVLSRTEADLIGTTRLERVPVAEWARRQRMSRNAAYKARLRAERRLVDHLRESEPDTRIRRAGSALAAVVVTGAVLLLSGATASAGVVLAAPVQSIDAVLTNIRNWLVGISAALAAVCFTVAFLRRMAGAGDPGEIEKSKTSFRAACVGLVGVLLTPVVIEVLKGFVGA